VSFNVRAQKNRNGKSDRQKYSDSDDMIDAHRYLRLKGRIALAHQIMTFLLQCSNILKKGTLKFKLGHYGSKLASTYCPVLASFDP
jgi:hypothetical protein